MNYIEAFLSSGGYIILGVLFDCACVIAFLKHHLKVKRRSVKPEVPDIQDHTKDKAA